MNKKECKAAEQGIETYIRAVMDSLPVGVAVNSVDPGNFSYMNDSFVSIYRTTREALNQPDNFWNAVYEDPEFREQISKRVLEDCASGDPKRMHWEDVPITRKGEKTTYINARNTPLPGRNLMVSTVIDITERKQAEEALADEANRHQVLMNQSRDGIVILRQDGRVYEANRKFADMLGYSLEEAGRLNVLDWEFIFPPERTLEMIGSVDEKGDHFETRHRRKDGSVYDVEISTNAAWFAGEKLVFCVCRDITERRLAEVKIRRSERLLQRLLELHRLAEKTADDVLTHTMESTQQVSESEFAFLGLMSEDESSFTLGKWSENLMAQRHLIDAAPHFSVAESGLLGEPVRRRAPVIVNDYDAATEKKKGYPAGHFPVKRFLGIPVISGNRIVAICGVANKATDYNETDVHALSSLLHEAWNIVELKTRENKLRKLSQAVEQSPVSVMITDLAGNIEYVNPKFTDVTGYTLKEIRGRNPRILKSGEHQAEYYLELWETISSGKEWQGEFHNRKKNGETYWEQASISPIMNNHGVPTHYLAVKEDITERKATENELVAAKEKAEESNRLKTAFMNNISHEVRTPLNGILGFGDLMMDENLSRQEKEEYHLILQRSCQRLQQIITDIMDVSQITAGSIKPRLKDVRIAPLMTRLMNEIEEACSQKNIAVALEIPVRHENLVLRTDEDFLSKIISHLLDNAAKFTAKGRVALGYDVGNDTVEFFVRDTGKGIPAEKLDLVMEPFIQEETSISRGYEGSGIGVPIAKGLVELLGGKLRVESRQGQGSVFSFSLPLITGKSGQKPRTDAASRQDSPDGTVILIAEDDEVNYQFIDAVATRNGFSTLHAWNGAEAVELCRQHPEIGLILMDVKMPGMNGLEATGQIKSFRPDVPVVAITAYAQTGDRERILEAGCDEYLAKPLRINELNALIEKILNRS